MVDESVEVERETAEENQFVERANEDSAAGCPGIRIVTIYVALSRMQ